MEPTATTGSKERREFLRSYKIKKKNKEGEVDTLPTSQEMVK